MSLSDQALNFKRENQSNWHANTSYWLSSPLRHVEDTREYLKAKLISIMKPGMSIVDMGCGSGWLLELLQEIDIPFVYKGLDFTPEFIEFLCAKYHGLPNVSFAEVDLEVPLQGPLIASADIVFNGFNFFEMLGLKVAFENAAKMLKPDGRVILLTIDPIYLAFAVSDDLGRFKDVLRQYEELKSKGVVPHFFQNIDLGDAESTELRYASVLYSLDDFYKNAVLNGLRLSDYGEVVKTSKFLPKTYQYIVFAR